MAVVPLRSRSCSTQPWLRFPFAAEAAACSRGCGSPSQPWPWLRSPFAAGMAVTSVSTIVIAAAQNTYEAVEQHTVPTRSFASTLDALGSKSRWTAQTFYCCRPAFRQCGPQLKPQWPCGLGQVVENNVPYGLWRCDGQPTSNIQPCEGVEFICCVVSQIRQGTNRSM